MDIQKVILATAFAIVKGMVSVEPPVLHISLEDGSNKIFIAEKTTFNVTVKFSGVFYDDVVIDVLPTIDVPDVFITKVKSVKVGSSLHFTGNTTPVMDYGRPELQTPGKALSCQFHLGKLIKTPKTRKTAPELFRSSKMNKDIKKQTDTSPEDDVILIQYEALIPEVRSEGFAEVGHNHMYAVRVCTADKTYFEYKHVKVAARSLPVLFRSMEKFPALKGNLIKEMFINMDEPKVMKYYN